MIRALLVLTLAAATLAAVLLYGASCARVLAESQGEFAARAVPPPAAAVTAVQGEVRRAGGDEAQVGTAAAAAALSDMTDGAEKPAGASGGASPARAVPAQRPTALVGQALGDVVHKLRAKDLAVAAAVGVASYWVLRPRGGEARLGRPARRPDGPGAAARRGSGARQRCGGR